MSLLQSQTLESTSSDERVAVSELKKSLKIDDPAAIFFFCTSNYDLDILADALNQAFECQLTGCTTAGEIVNGYKPEGIVALVFSKEMFAIHPLFISDMKSFDLAEAMQLAHTVERKLHFSPHLEKEKMFGFLMSDGLSLKEENLIARLNQSFDVIDIFGGSAGDNLKFEKTHVFFDGAFHTNAAVLNIIEIECDFSLFKTQHFVATEKELITTDVDFDKRIVKEINGEPAADAFAKINNLDCDSLSITDFAMYPLMISMSDEWYIRSIASVNEDKSLQFYCAIDDGLPLSVAQGQDMLVRLKEKAQDIHEEFEEIYFTLGCDCILRKVENINNDALQSFDDTFTKLKFIGFNSYGEQFNGVHFNQTMAAVVIGKKRNG